MIWWDEWRGQAEPTMWVRHLFPRSLPRGPDGRRIVRWGVLDLHKFIRKDDPDCFHTHPGYAVRIILWGGYVEELEGGRHRIWLPGMVGLVTPRYTHRVAGLRNGRVSYSLWLRFRNIMPVYLRGEGWKHTAGGLRP